jgi:hypothetical protein
VPSSETSPEQQESLRTSSVFVAIVGGEGARGPMKKATGTGALIGTNVAVVVMVSAEEDAAAEE